MKGEKMSSASTALFIAVGILFLLLQTLIIALPLRNKSKEEIEQMNEDRKEWARNHPFLVILLLFIPTPLAILIEYKIFNRKSDDRDIHYSSIENGVQYGDKILQFYGPLPADDPSNVVS